MGTYREFFIFVEGYKDWLFFDAAVKFVFSEGHDSVEVIEWARERPRKIDNHIKSIKSENWNADYIFVTDMDAPCVTARKDEIRKKFRSVDEDKIVVVGKEIESWYLAVLGSDRCKDLGIPFFRTTSDVTKEQFDELVPEEFDSEIDFMRELLKSFDIETAKRRNQSFKYFAEKHGL